MERCQSGMLPREAFAAELWPSRLAGCWKQLSVTKKWPGIYACEALQTLQYLILWKLGRASALQKCLVYLAFAGEGLGSLNLFSSLLFFPPCILHPPVGRVSCLGHRTNGFLPCLNTCVSFCFSGMRSLLHPLTGEELRFLFLFILFVQGFVLGERWA